MNINLFCSFDFSKAKTQKMENVSDEHFLIYEIVKVKSNELEEFIKTTQKR